jgi:hypothetical protein
VFVVRAPGGCHLRRGSVRPKHQNAAGGVEARVVTPQSA